MSVGKLCTRSVVFVDRQESVQQAAALMRQHHVGDLVVIDVSMGRRVPIGMLTDRDIVVGAVALGVDPERLRVADLMSKNILTAREQDDEQETEERMRSAGVRRMPVVNQDGELVGLIAVDDLLDRIAEQMKDLARIPGRQRMREKRERELSRGPAQE